MKDKFRYRGFPKRERKLREWQDRALLAEKMGVPPPRHPDWKPAKLDGTEFERAVRLDERERRRLGLPTDRPVTRAEITRANHYAMMDKLLAKEAAALEEMSVAMRIAFNGSAPIVDYSAVSETWDGEEVQANRNLNSCPLDNLYYISKNPLSYLEWVAGKRFEADWQRAHSDQPLTVSMDQLAMAKIDRPSAKDLAHLSPEDRERARIVTFRPSAPKRVRRRCDVSDNRLDAIQRLGRIRDEVSSISFWLLEQVCGHERNLKQCSQQLGWRQEYASGRFREALWEAAAHYRLTSEKTKAEG